MNSVWDFYIQYPARFDAYLFDLDGTILWGKDLIPGADRMIRRLHEDGVPVCYLTNNSSQTHGQLVKRFADLGISASENEFVRCSDPIPDYFRQINRSGHEWRFFVIGPMDDVPGVVSFERDPKMIMFCDGVLHCGSIYDWREGLTAIVNFFLRYPDRPLLVPNPDMLNPLKDSVSVCVNAQLEIVIQA